MLDRTYLETKANWQATFALRDGKIWCLMRAVTGGFYWYESDYQGLFAWGASSNFNQKNFADGLERGNLRLLAGTIPQEISNPI